MPPPPPNRHAHGPRGGVGSETGRPRGSARRGGARAPAPQPAGSPRPPTPCSPVPSTRSPPEGPEVNGRGRRVPPRPRAGASPADFGGPASPHTGSRPGAQRAGRRRRKCFLQGAQESVPPEVPVRCARESVPQEVRAQTGPAPGKRWGPQAWGRPAPGNFVPATCRPAGAGWGRRSRSPRAPSPRRRKEGLLGR